MIRVPVFIFSVHLARGFVWNCALWNLRTCYYRLNQTKTSHKISIVRKSQHMPEIYFLKNKQWICLFDTLNDYNCSLYNVYGSPYFAMALPFAAVLSLIVFTLELVYPWEDEVQVNNLLFWKNIYFDINN